MILAESKIRFAGDIDKAWAKMVDWEHMQDWDHFMERMEFERPFAPGMVGTLTMKGGRKVLLKVTEMVAEGAERHYTDEFSFLGSRFIFHHFIADLKTSQENLEMRFAIEGQGLMVSILRLQFARAFKKELPRLMAKFKEQFLAA